MKPEFTVAPGYGEKDVYDLKRALAEVADARYMCSVGQIPKPLPSGAEDQLPWNDRIEFFLTLQWKKFFANWKAVTAPIKKGTFVGYPHFKRSDAMLASVLKDYLADPLAYLRGFEDKVAYAKIGYRIQTDKITSEECSKVRHQVTVGYAGTHWLQALRMRVINALDAANLMMAPLWHGHRAAYEEDTKYTLKHIADDLDHKSKGYMDASDADRYDQRYPRVAYDTMIKEMSKVYPLLASLSARYATCPMLVSKAALSQSAEVTKKQINRDFKWLDDKLYEQYLDWLPNDGAEKTRRDYLDAEWSKIDMKDTLSKVINAMKKDGPVDGWCIWDAGYRGNPSGQGLTSECAKFYMIALLSWICETAEGTRWDERVFWSMYAGNYHIGILNQGDDAAVTAEEAGLMKSISAKIAATPHLSIEDPKKFIGLRMNTVNLKFVSFKPRVNGFVRKLSAERPLSEKALPSVGVSASYAMAAQSGEDELLTKINKAFTANWMPISAWISLLTEWDRNRSMEIPVELQGKPMALADIVDDVDKLLWKYVVDKYPEAYFINITASQLDNIHTQLRGK